MNKFYLRSQRHLGPLTNNHPKGDGICLVRDRNGSLKMPSTATSEAVLMMTFSRNLNCYEDVEEAHYTFKHAQRQLLEFHESDSLKNNG